MSGSNGCVLTRPGRVFLGIRGGGVFHIRFHPTWPLIFRPGVGRNYVIILRLQRQQKDFKKSISNWHKLLFLTIWN